MWPWPMRMVTQCQSVVLPREILVSSNDGCSSRFWSWSWSIFWDWALVEILRLKFGQDCKTEVWPMFWSWSFVDILKPNFDQLVTSWYLWQDSHFGESSRALGLLCLWQCFTLLTQGAHFFRKNPLKGIFLLYCHNVLTNYKLQIKPLCISMYKCVHHTLIPTY